MASNNDVHKQNLEKLCRICACKFDKSKLRKISVAMVTSIKNLYGIDVGNEDAYLHPTNICGTCRTRIQRCDKALKTGEPGPTFPAMINLAPHTHNCSICANVFKPTGGRPKKSSNLVVLVEEEPAAKKLKPAEPVDIARQLEFDAQPCKPTFNINSIPLVQVSEEVRNVAKIFICSLCQSVPVVPVQVSDQCGHIFCVECISDWQQLLNEVCPECQLPIDVDDFRQLKTPLREIHRNITVGCRYLPAGCMVSIPIVELVSHCSSCPFKDKKSTNKKRGKPKEPLRNVGNVYARDVRLAPLVTALDNFCAEQDENKGDVLFFLLKEHLKNLLDPRAETVLRLWDKEIPGQMSLEECLALRVSNLQSKASYARQYDFFRQRNQLLLQPPAAVTSHEGLYLPGTARYTIESAEEGLDYHHTPAKLGATTKRPIQQESSISQDGTESVEPLDVLAGLQMKMLEKPTPNCRGVRYAYADAIAKTLEELNAEIEEGLQNESLSTKDSNAVFLVTIKDGADGLGSVSQYIEKDNKVLPDNAFRFTFAVMKIEVLVDSGRFVVYKSSNPNSVRVNRPLLESVADENSEPTIAAIMSPIESERDMLKNSIMKVWVGNGLYRRFEFDFFFSMIDEKLDRAEGGLMGSGSNYLCTLCHVPSPDEAKNDVGKFSITRTYQETFDTARFTLDNPDKLTSTQLKALSKGINGVPLVKEDAKRKGIDATHADINLANFFYKLIVREVAGVQSWAVRPGIKPMLDDAAKRFDEHMTFHLGMPPSLMMPGNYARALFNPEKVDMVFALIPDEQKQAQLKKIFSKLDFLRKMYRASNPHEDYADEISIVKNTGVELGIILRDHFPYAPWSNYLHKVIEHTQQLLEEGAQNIGGMSGEGNEAGNRIFRHVRANLSSRSNTMDALRDVLKVHWLYSSPALLQIAEIQRNPNACSLCHQLGHKKPTCTFRDAICELHKSNVELD